MTIQQAEQFIRAYRQLLSDDSTRGSRRDPALLPVSKEQVMKAIKLELAHLYILNSHTNEDLTRPLINAALFLDSFSDLPIQTSEFIESMHRRRREIDSYYVELIKLDRSDPFFWQRVYTLLGIGLETRKTSFLEGVKQRFGIGARTSESEPAHFLGARRVGRLTLD